MTAIGAAIIELKAHCEHTWEVIRALERFAAVVEDAHGPSPTVTPGAVPVASVTTRAVIDVAKVTAAVAGKLPKVATKRRLDRRAKPNGKPAKASTKPAATAKASATFTAGAEILRILGTRAEPLAPKEIIRLAKMPRWKGMRLILDLAKAGSLVRVGHHRGAKYTLAHQPRPGAVAGTQAAPPVGPSPANGLSASHARKSSDGPFEVAWNGTKERTGEAPTILPPRGRLT